MAVNIYKRTYGSPRPGILQEAVLEANRSTPASFKTMGNTFTPNAARIEQDLMDLKVNMGMRRATGGLFQGGVSGAAYKTLYPQKYQSLLNKSLDANKQALRKTIIGASLTGNQEALTAARSSVSQALRTGGRFGFSMPTRLGMAVNASVLKTQGKMAMAGVGMMNTASKVVLGASLGQIGFAGGIVAGLGYMAGSALGISGSQVADTARAVHQTFKAAGRPTYGYSELGQSVNGLVFGLNSRRTA